MAGHAIEDFKNTSRGRQCIWRLNSSRYFAYSAIALYESVVPGMPAYQHFQDQLTAMPAYAANNSWYCLSLANLCKCCTRML